MRALPKTMDLIFLVVTALMSHTLYGLATLSVLSGQREGAMQFDVGRGDQPAKSDDMALTVMTDPIPFVPIGLEVTGMRHELSNLTASDPYFANARLTGGSLGLQAWVPMLPLLTPYARVAAVLGGARAEYQGADLSYVGNTNVDYLLSGQEIGVGVRFKPLPLPILDLYLRVEYIFTSYDLQFAKFGDESILPTVDSNVLKKDIAWNTNGWAIGASVGI